MFSKQAGYGGDGDEYWEAEVRGRLEGASDGVLQAGGVWTGGDGDEYWGEAGEGDGGASDGVLQAGEYGGEYWEAEVRGRGGCGG